MTNGWTGAENDGTSRRSMCWHSRHLSILVVINDPNFLDFLMNPDRSGSTAYFGIQGKSLSLQGKRPNTVPIFKYKDFNRIFVFKVQGACEFCRVNYQIKRVTDEDVLGMPYYKG
jgi:hypothetical protein